ncbi:MAG: ribonuclease Y [Planctomycetes bacterium]|nr:ribonuclease Y [Planctomycetota bacterium]
MPDVLWLIIGLVAGLGGGAGGYYFISRQMVTGARQQAELILSEAREKREALVKEGEVKAKDEMLRMRTEAERDRFQKMEEIKNQERAAQKKEDQLDRKNEDLQRLAKQLEGERQSLADKVKNVEAKTLELQKTLAAQQATLEKLSGMGKEEATRTFYERLQQELANDVAARIRKAQELAKDRADEEARKIVIGAIQRTASDHSSENTTSTVDLPSEDMKGRIIGREGRNIRAFEKATGVDVIVDDTPGVIVLSGFEPVRRETARRAMEKLVQDGRIHPTRIEEIIEGTKKEMEELIQQTGKQTCYELDIQRLSPKVVPVLGRLRFRTSYGQNVLKHSIEVAKLAAIMAAEVGLDPKLALRAGLLHDIGKALDQEMEGTHPQIGFDLLKRAEEPHAVCDTALRHHETEKAETPYCIITAAADAISASRPGARGESLEKYIKRLQDLERIATNKQGVEGAFAIQAGRELRVLVNASKIDDATALIVAKDIAKQIEAEMTYPGEIRVTVIRETRVTEYAR